MIDPTFDVLLARTLRTYAQGGVRPIDAMAIAERAAAAERPRRIADRWRAPGRPVVTPMLVGLLVLVLAATAIVVGAQLLAPTPTPPRFVVESLGPVTYSTQFRSGTLDGPMTRARSGHTATLLADGRVLITGGLSGWPGDDPRTAELYAPSSGTFSATARMLSDRHGHTATRLADGRILIVGGQDDSGNLLASAEIYDPDTGTFSATGSPAGRRSGHAAALLPDGRVAIIGGFTDGLQSLSPAPTIEFYDPATGTFETRPTAAVLERADFDAIVLDDGRLFIAGGHDPVTQSYGDVAVFGAAAIYDPMTGTVDSIPLRAAGPTHDGVGGWVDGSTKLADGRVLVAVDHPDQEGWGLVVVDPVAGTTTRLAPIGGYPVAGLTTLAGGEVLVLTSRRSDCRAVNAAVFDPESAIVHEAGTLPTIGTCNGPGRPTATALDDGSAMVAGGSLSGGETAPAAALIRPVDQR
jgi:hypothetical protein